MTVGHATEVDRAGALALADAVRIVGGQTRMARLLGVAQPSVWRWLKLGKPLAAEHVEKVEKATGISRHLLRPDLPWGADPLPALPPLPTTEEAAR